MATAIGFGLLLMVATTIGLFFAIFRWLNKPKISDETLEALWSVVVALQDNTCKLETLIERLERTQRLSSPETIDRRILSKG